MRIVSGEDRTNWRTLFKSDLEARHWFVLEQDRVALEALADDARKHEILYQHDIGVTRLRKWLGAKAREDIARARACASLKEANGMTTTFQPRPQSRARARQRRATSSLRCDFPLRPPHRTSAPRSATSI